MFFSDCLHLRSFPLKADRQKSDSSVDGEPQENWRWNSNCRDVVASSPSFSRSAARAPRRACSHAGQNYSFVSHKYVSRALYQTVQTTKLKSLWKPVRLTSFKKPKFFTFFFKFIHLSLLLYLLGYLYLLLMFWEVIFVFQSFGDSPHWWNFGLIEVFEELPTYPSLSSKFCPKWDANVNVELGKG